jgi:multiple sugar transport system substrate-binding protein
MIPLMGNGTFSMMQAEHYWYKSVRTDTGDQAANVVFGYEMPGTADSLVFIFSGEVLQMGSTDNPAAWDLAKFYGWKNPQTGTLDTFIAWAQAAALAAPYPAFFQDPTVQTAFAEYYDLPKFQSAFENSNGVSARNLPWYPTFNIAVGDRVQAMLLGQASPKDTLSGLASDATNAAAGG